MAVPDFTVTEELFIRQVYSPQSPKVPSVDFVFVHGLNPSNRPNHAFQTWTHATCKTPWPYQLLPKDFPEARIWIFGYNSKVTRGVSEANISDHANNLLENLQRERQQGYGESSRIPIIFLGHSLGGLVIKQALLNAQVNPRFNSTWEASFGLVFFGTPHQGGNSGGLATLAAGVAKFIANDTAGNNLLMCLAPNSIFTQESAERFSLQQGRYRIRTFFETIPTEFHGFSKIVVNRRSAILGAPHEVHMELNRNHRDICKFAEGNAYDTFKGNLREIVSQALGPVGQTLTSTSQLKVESEDGPLGCSTTSVSSQGMQQMPSQETLASHSSTSTYQNNASLEAIRKLNNRFLEAVRELDSPLIHNWIKDPIRRSKLNVAHVRSALLSLSSLKEAKAKDHRDPCHRLQAVAVILREYGLDIDLECRDDIFEGTPLILAASCGREDIAKLLIDKGASLQAKDGRFDRTPLSWAARNNFVGIAVELLKASNENQDRQTIHSKDIDGYTALDLASHRGHRNMMELLKSQGADLKI